MARRIYVVVGADGAVIGDSPSLMGAKKISAMNGWRDKNGALFYGAVYKEEDVKIAAGSEYAEVLGAPVAERMISHGVWSWTDRMNQQTLPYGARTEKGKADARKSTNKYRDKFVKTTVLLPKDVNEALIASDPASKNSYIVGLIRDDLRERGHLID